MIIDKQQITQNLLRFYDFENKVMIYVGTSIEPVIRLSQIAKRVVVLNNDVEAMEGFLDFVRNNGLEEKFDIKSCDFDNMNIQGDVILFEFSLHKMENPCEVVKKSLQYVSDVVILDHWSSSEWLYYIAEEANVSACWKAIHSMSPRKSKLHACVRYFPKYEDLKNTLKHKGDISLGRTNLLNKRTNICIAMLYNLALISR
jgi:phage terminase large subunit